MMKDCNEQWPGGSNGRRQYTMAILFATYIIPLAILCTVYLHIGLVLRKRAQPGGIAESMSESDRCPIDAKKKVKLL